VAVGQAEVERLDHFRTEDTVQPHFFIASFRAAMGHADEIYFRLRQFIGSTVMRESPTDYANRGCRIGIASLARFFSRGHFSS